MCCLHADTHTHTLTRMCVYFYNTHTHTHTHLCTSAYWPHMHRYSTRTTPAGTYLGIVLPMGANRTKTYLRGRAQRYFPFSTSSPPPHFSKEIFNNLTHRKDHSPSRSTFEIMLFVRPTRGHGGPYRVKRNIWRHLSAFLHIIDIQLI